MYRADLRVQWVVMYRADLLVQRVVMYRADPLLQRVVMYRANTSSCLLFYGCTCRCIDNNLHMIEYLHYIYIYNNISHLKRTHHLFVDYSISKNNLLNSLKPHFSK